MPEETTAAPEVVSSRSGRAPVPPTPGVYVAVLACTSSRGVRIGALGTLALERGFYGYVGSAHGPGGLAARLSRHRRRTRSPHWHVDHLRRHTAFREAWFAEGPSEWEHAWADALEEVSGASVPMRGFGCSDCRCESHLFRFPRMPSLAAFRRRLGAAAAVALVLLTVQPARAGSWSDVEPHRTEESEIIRLFGAPNEIVATFPWSEWSASWKARPDTRSYVFRYEAASGSTILDGPGGRADHAEVHISNGFVLAIEWHYGGPSARAAATRLRADPDIALRDVSQSHGSKALPSGRLFTELFYDGSKVRVVYDLK